MKSIEEIRKITEENKKEVEIPKEVEEKLGEFILAAAKMGNSYTVISIPKFTTCNTDDVDAFIIEHFHAVMEYYRKHDYTVTVSMNNIGSADYTRVACISW